jgi:hypothetical protein
MFRGVRHSSLTHRKDVIIHEMGPKRGRGSRTALQEMQTRLAGPCDSSSILWQSEALPRNPAVHSWETAPVFTIPPVASRLVYPWPPRGGIANVTRRSPAEFLFA